MGKCGSRKKKSNGSASVIDMPAKQEPVKRQDVPTAAVAVPPTAESSPATLKMEHLAAVFVHRARELKEEGNRRFQNKDYHGAMENYEQALRLTPRNHPDRAVFHSNRAACLMQMKPVQYEAVIRECSLALEAHPCFGRALFRRARALEALGKLELALQDAQLLLQTDGNNPDALELARRLRTALRRKEESSQEGLPQSRAATASSSPKHSGTSAAALGASVVNGSPMASKGPPKLIVKKKGGKSEQPHPRVAFSDSMQNIMFTPEGWQSSASSSTTSVKDLLEHACTDQQPGSERVSSPLQSKVLKLEVQKMPVAVKALESHESSSVEEAHPGSMSMGISACVEKQSNAALRPLKLVYDHDIRLAKMPLGCKIKELRELVRKRFPSSKAVLIKYKDADGDLVTITSTWELRLAEAALESEVAKRRCSIECCSNDTVSAGMEHLSEPLRLNIVEVPTEQEPVFEDEDEDASLHEGIHEDAIVQLSQASKEIDGVTALPSKEDTEVVGSRKSGLVGSCCDDSSDKDDQENKSREIEMDDWLVDFAQLFRTHIGVDPDVHVDLHELGMELCSEALEETVSSEDAQPLFEAAACKFQEVAALAFFNWGNVHMSAARKRIPLEGTNGDGEYQKRLQMAYDWAHGQYEQARLKYEEACKVKSDFYEGVLALGQESFESAKLRWSLATASQVDLTTWDSSETLGLFDKAQERMQTAFVMWEKLEEVRLNEAKTGHRGSHREMKGHRDPPQELSEAETKEQFLVMRFQINLFWGNILFEHSQVQYKLGISSWKSLLDDAVKKFELAGASPADIAVVMNNHISNSNCACEATKPVITPGSSSPLTKSYCKAEERRDVLTPLEDKKV